MLQNRRKQQKTKKPLVVVRGFLIKEQTLIVK